jgi:Sugar-transfer associated ATP-grasp
MNSDSASFRQNSGSKRSAARNGGVATALRKADLKLYQTARSSYQWLKHERKAQIDLPFRQKMEMWRRGFFAESATIYDLPRNDPREYLSDFQHFVRCGRINAWEGFYTHKLGLRSLLLAMGFRQAETLAYIHERRIMADPFSEDAGYISLEELFSRLATGNASFIVKPEDGWCGEDIFLLTLQDGKFMRRRGQHEEPFDFDAYMGELEGRARREKRDPSGVLIERRLEQGAFWRALFPDSANTLRLLTLWTPGEPAPFVARAVQRIGTADTVPTDNWSGGGISAPVDLATGTLGEGRMHPLKGKRAEQRFTHHPDTGALIAGAVLPGWTQAMDTVLRAAASVPFNRMAGWDILVDAEGVPVILEANGNSDVNLLQVHGGLLAEPRVRRFYQAFGVVNSAPGLNGRSRDAT